MNFYHYRQNNSGGSFDINDDVTVHVFIEANSQEEADSKAESIGIYFDGCDDGKDCPCCGDRWYHGDVVEFPINWDSKTVFNNIEEYAACCGKDTMWANPSTRVHYADGSKRDFSVD